jgi:isopentenyl-diphosphate delta-isomerase
LVKIEQVCSLLDAPVVAKEVGWGISTETARQLMDAGVAAIDVAGAGGTDWALVEGHRSDTPMGRRLAATFAEWGIPTAASLLMAQEGAPGMPIIASGGVYDGIAAAKAIALGASLVGIARPFLNAAMSSVEQVLEVAEELIEGLRLAMMCVGAGDLESLRETPHLKRLR